MAFEEFKTKVGDFFGSDMLPVALGMGAQAVMEEHQNSWPALLGKSAVGLQQSKIAADAARRQGNERDSINRLIANLLAGKGLTEQGYPGVTSINLKTAPNKEQTITVKGDEIAPAFGQSALAAAKGNKGQAPSAGPGGGVDPRAGSPAPTTAPNTIGAIDPRLLPLILAQGVRSSAGAAGGPQAKSTVAPLSGLTPEQITQITRSGILGAESQQRGINDIFTNMQRQAYSGYLSDRGRAAPIAAAAELAKQNRLSQEPFSVQRGANGNLMIVGKDRTVTDTGVPFQDDVQVIDQGSYLTLRYPDGRTQTLSKQMTPQQQTEFDRKLTDTAARIDQTITGYIDRNGNRIPATDPVQADVDFYHQNSRSPHVYLKTADGWKKFVLPRGYAPWVVYAAVMERRRRGENITFEDMVRTLLNTQYGQQITKDVPMARGQQPTTEIPMAQGH